MQPKGGFERSSEHRILTPFKVVRVNSQGNHAQEEIADGAAISRIAASGLKLAKVTLFNRVDSSPQRTSSHELSESTTDETVAEHSSPASSPAEPRVLNSQTF